MVKLDMNFVPKGWGFEKWIVNKEEYCGKLLYFGKLKVLYGAEDDLEEANSVILEKGDNFYVYPGLRHQMIALEDTELFEFSTQHFDEDSYRVIKGD